MVMITLDIPKELNKKIEHFKVENELKDKREAIVKMLKLAAQNKIELVPIEEIFKEVDMSKPVKISISRLRKMKDAMYLR